MAEPAETFPRQYARTRGFRLGAPRSFHVSPDGRRVLFLRSGAGDDPVNRLWCADVGDDDVGERLVADPLDLLGSGDEDLPPAERARRERMRETTGGVTAFGSDNAGALAVFALSGRLFVVDVEQGGSREIDVDAPVVDPRPDPTGRRVAFVADRSLRVVDTSSGAELARLAPESPTVAYGLADFVAAEELDRVRGFWWSPDGDQLLVERFDEADVPLWWISDPAEPSRRPVEHRYPAAGQANPAVSLHLLRLDGRVTDVDWGADDLPYLATASWSTGQPPLITVLSRDQRRMQTRTVDPATGATTVVRDDDDPCWVDVVPGAPALSARGRLVHAWNDRSADTLRLAIDGVAVTAPGWQLRRVAQVDDDGVIALGSVDPTELHAVRVSWDASVTPLTPAGGYHSVTGAGGTTVSVSTSLATTAAAATIRRGDVVHEIASYAEVPLLQPAVTLLRAGARELRTAVLWPTGHVRGERRLPVLMAPYGGPHHLEVVASGAAFTQAQWFADQGFCVVVTDGAGTPGRGPAWEREVHRDFPRTLDDQVAALEAVGVAFPDDVDLGRVGIRGWSFGGWLAALAVLRRPDVFHAAVAGAPVTDWRRYDTAYTERYLGHPDESPAVYDANSLLADAPGLRRPLLLVHGLADDNVVAAHTLALSGALLAAGRPHTVLPLTGVTHMTPQQVVAENLLLLQARFLLDHLTPRG